MMTLIIWALNAAMLCRFDNVRVPLDALLDRYASVSPDGTYSSPIPTVGARFGTMVGSPGLHGQAYSAEFMNFHPDEFEQPQKAKAV